jgi:hypothetical protein
MIEISIHYSKNQIIKEESPLTSRHMSTTWMDDGIIDPTAQEFQSPVPVDSPVEISQDVIPSETPENENLPQV